MKKNKVMRFACILLVVTMMSTSVVSGTFAKYTSTTEATSNSAYVAKWSIIASQTDSEGNSASADIAQNDSITFNLFDSSKVYDLYKDSAENDAFVADGTDDAIIAPGTWGYTVIEVENNSEVWAELTFTAEVTDGSSVPLKYCAGITMEEITIDCAEQILNSSLDIDTCTHFVSAADIQQTFNFDNTAATDHGKSHKFYNTIGYKDAKWSSKITETGKRYIYLVWAWPYDEVENAIISSGNYNMDTVDTELGTYAVSNTPSNVTVKITMTATQVEITWQA